MKTLTATSIFVITLATTPSANAQEYFGAFIDKLRGTFNIEAKPRPTFRLEVEFRFNDPNGLQWVAPPETEVDGASIPQPFWSFIGGPFEGEYINASVIHDHYCRTKTRTAHDTHRNFYYGMRASNVPEWKAQFMYWAVSTFGPDWKLQPRVTVSQTCSSAVGDTPICTTVPTIAIELVTSPPVDLSDPEVLAAALSKATAVARTLRTSDGKVLDVNTNGQVLATVENVQANSAAYRQVFAGREFASSPAKLGVLVQASSSTLSDIQPWAGNRIPKLVKTPVLTQQTARVLDDNAPFKLDPRSKGLLQDRVDIRNFEATIRLKAPE